MNRIAIVTWILVGGVVWGGLVAFVVTAYRKERSKERRAGEGAA